jgi:hypothetical protein
MVGITETKKMIGFLNNSIVDLRTVDYQLVIDEMKDMDDQERNELLIMFGKIALNLLLKAMEYKTLLKFILR